MRCQGRLQGQLSSACKPQAGRPCPAWDWQPQLPLLTHIAGVGRVAGECPPATCSANKGRMWVDGG